MSQPAVPDGGITSNSLEGTPQVVSQEEVPPPDRTSEVVSRTGSISDLDSFIRSHFVTVASLVWSVSQVAGELLWTSPIHPNFINEIISHLYQLFNVWTGGFDYKIKVAGTGFHAGMLVMYRLPPNISPTSVKTVSQITHFPYVLIEAKSLEMECAEFFDQLNTWFHYTSPQYDPNNPGSFGGHVCIAVWSPLVATGSGAQQINVIVSTKAAQTFTFNQIIPPSIRNDIDSGRDLSYLKAFFPLRPFSRLFNMPFEQLHVRSTQTTVALTAYTQGCFTFAKQAMSDIAKYTVRERMWFWSGADGIPYGYEDIENASRQPQVYAFNPASITELDFDSATRITSGTAGTITADPTTDTFTSPNKFGFLNPYISNQAFTQQATQTTALVPPLPESFVFFKARVAHYGGPWDYYRCQTEEMSDILQFGQPASMMSNQAVRVLVSDKTLSLPLFYIKVHHAGYITTNASTTSLTYNYNDLEFTPDMIMQVTDPLPTNFASNMLLYKFKRFNI